MIMSNTTECRGTIWLHAIKLKFQRYKQRLQGNAMFVRVCECVCGPRSDLLL